LIDYVKIWVLLYGQEFKLPKNSPLKMFGIFDRDTNEVLEGNFSQFEGLSCKVRYKTINGWKRASFLEIRLSLHRMSNDFGHNYNDFNYSALCNTIENLSEWFGVAPEQMILKNLEYGVNVKLPFAVREVLSNLLFHKRNLFYMVHNGRGDYKQAKPAQSFVKAYNKGEQFSLPYNLLRFENKYMVSRAFNKHGIKTLNDLKDIDKLFKLHQELIQTWGNCLIYEPPILDSSDLNFEKKLLQWSNAHYWEGLMNQRKDRNKFSREVRLYKKYLKDHTDNKKEQIANLIMDKWSEFEMCCKV
jgi:hypothetical protein